MESSSSLKTGVLQPDSSSSLEISVETSDFARAVLEKLLWKVQSFVPKHKRADAGTDMRLDAEASADCKVMKVFFTIGVHTVSSNMLSFSQKVMVRCWVSA
jgi:hypothetical protein